MQNKIETCQNCGHILGKLETAYLYKNHVVCGKCDSLLKAETNKDNLESIKKSTGFLASFVKAIIILFLIYCALQLLLAILTYKPA